MYRGTSVQTLNDAARAASGTPAKCDFSAVAQPVGEDASSGHATGLRWHRSRKSSAKREGRIIRFACRWPGAMPDVSVMLLLRASRRVDKAMFLVMALIAGNRSANVLYVPAKTAQSAFVFIPSLPICREWSSSDRNGIPIRLGYQSLSYSHLEYQCNYDFIIEHNRDLGGELLLKIQEWPIAAMAGIVFLSSPQGA